MIWCIYLLFCIGVLLGADDGEPWTFWNFILFIFAGFYVPVIIGVYLGKFFRKKEVSNC